MSNTYNNLIFDAVNFGYRTYNNREEIPIQISQKAVLREFVCNFINDVESLRMKYTDPDSGQIYLLFDNYYSRADLKSAFMFADRKKINESYKANRTKSSKAFYNSLNFIRYYYLIGPERYHTARIDGLEADDLVKPLLEGRCKDSTCLMVTTDLDWCRYLSKKVDWLPKLDEEPQTVNDLSKSLGFDLTECSLICYKSIFGDASDNIDSILTNNDKNLSDFIEVVKDIQDPYELIIKSRGFEERVNSPVLQAIADNEKIYQINVQLVSSIPCAPSHLETVITSGRNAETLFKCVREAVCLDVKESPFKFGNIKRPRQ